MTVPQEKQMNAGVELLLERMKTHPEEFYIENQLRMGGSKWDKLWHMYKDYLSEEDQEAYIDGLKAVNQQRFTEHILEGLVDPKSSNGGNDQYYQNLKNTALGGATQGGYTLTSDGAGQISWTGGGGGGQLQQAQQAKAMLEHLEAHRNAIAAEEKAKQKKISMLERMLGK